MGSVLAAMWCLPVSETAAVAAMEPRIGQKHGT